MTVISLWSRATVGWLFVAAGTVKLARPGSFRVALIGYHALAGHRRLRAILARAVPPVELAVGVSLLSGLFGGIVSLILAAPILALFVALIGDNARHGLKSDCGCGFGGSTSYPAIVRNIALVGLLIIGATTQSSGGSLKGGIGPRVLVAALALVAGACLAFAPTVADEMAHQTREHL